MKKLINDLLCGLILAGFLILVVCAIFYQDNKNNPPAEIESTEITTVSSSDPPQATESHETLTSLGMFTVTYYCPCIECCGKTDGITASGVKAIPNHTIATSSEFEFGTKLIIDGIEYTVEDRGGAITGNHIDIFVESHEQALSLGIKNIKVYEVSE